MMSKQPVVYILASHRNGTIYTGTTSNLVQRTWQHREHVTEGFTTKYNVTLLVWFELHDSMDAAILREKRIKKWRRADKTSLIESVNPYWRDLWEDIVS